jgi:AcrR family transcriptional regulator
MATKTARGELSRENLLEAARKVFRRQGYSNTTVRDIAAEAGIALGGIYRHFASKDEFVARVLADGMVQISQAVRQAVANLPPSASCRERIRSGIKAQIMTMRLHGESYEEAIRYQRSSLSPASVWTAYRTEADAYRQFWKQLIEKGQRDGEIRSDASSTILAFYLLGAATWVIQWQRPSRRSVDRIADDFSTYFFEGAGLPAGKKT